MHIEQVNYDALDKAKIAFMAASKKTMRFAERYGFVPDERLGASANVFALDLRQFLQTKAEQLYITLLPEGLGTADDARPDDLSDSELKQFWQNIGIKTVACMTNDAASTGMQTVLISLYLPSSNPEVVFSQAFLDGFLTGFTAGCKTVGCVWISGETPQLKTKIYEDKLDIAGALFGIMPPGTQPIDGTRLKAGDKIVFVASSGPHENGFTTLRKIAHDLPQGYRTELPDGKEFWQAINSPSNLYTPLIQQLLTAKIPITGIENVTGHGWRKLMRSNKPLAYRIKQMLPVPTIFKFVQESANIPLLEMLKIFNYGVGCALYVEGEDAATEIVRIAKSVSLDATIAGDIVSSDKRSVIVEPLGIAISDNTFALARE